MQTTRTSAVKSTLMSSNMTTAFLMCRWSPVFYYNSADLLKRWLCKFLQGVLWCLAPKNCAAFPLSPVSCKMELPWIGLLAPAHSTDAQLYLAMCAVVLRQLCSSPLTPLDKTAASEGYTWSATMFSWVVRVKLTRRAEEMWPVSNV